MKLQGIKDINWLMYKQYCWRYGLSEGQFKNLKRYMEGRNRRWYNYIKNNKGGLTMTITMSYKEYNKMQDFCKQFTVKKGVTRPILEYIRLTITGDTAQALVMPVKLPQ